MSEGTANWSKYQKRIRSVIEYIHDNPAGTLTSDHLAEVAHLSPYHWHRIYKSITGESAAATVKRCRMHNAAATLLRTDTSLAQVGASVGYPRIHSFTRTFKNFYGISPGKFREAQTEPQDTATSPEVQALPNQTIVIRQQSEARLIGSWHYGDFMTIGVTFEKVMAQCAISGIIPENPQMTGLYLADPECTEEPELKSFAGVVMQEDVVVPEGLVDYDYPSGHFAVLTHRGPYALLSQGYDWLYSKWMPSSDATVKRCTVQ